MNIADEQAQLQTFRNMLIEERRRVVRTALELRQTNGDGGLHGAAVKKIQEEIEAVDRAIRDEEKLRNYAAAKASTERSAEPHSERWGSEPPEDA